MKLILHDLARVPSVGIFDKTPSHNSRESAAPAVRMSASLNSDCVVSIGGGSTVDLARLVIDGLKEANGGLDVPIIAIPSTLSQAEYTDLCGVVVDRSKMVERRDAYLPRAVILDPHVTTGTARTSWLASAVKALDSALELYFTSTGPEPAWDPLLESAIVRFDRLLGDFSESVLDDLAWREELMLTAWVAAIPRSQLPSVTPRTKSDWLAKVVRHQLGAMFDVPHSSVAAPLLAPSVDLHVREAVEREERILELLPGVRGNLPEHLRGLTAQLGIPVRLRDIAGIDLAQINALFHACVLEDGSLVEREQEFHAALRSAW